MNDQDKPISDPAEQPVDDNRRKAMLRLAVYTAPAMLALLLSTQESAAICTSRCAP